MMGPWPLAPHHDYLQYIHHVRLMQRGKIWGVTHMGRVAKPETKIVPGTTWGQEEVLDESLNMQQLWCMI